MEALIRFYFPNVDIERLALEELIDIFKEAIWLEERLAKQQVDILAAGISKAFSDN